MSNFLTAAKWTEKQNPQPHQIAAWNAAWEWLSAEQQAEFLELFRAAPAAPAAPWLEPALKIIREFEGLRLEAYRCPAGVPTIGYGATRLIDAPVRMGDKITQQMAEELLRNQVENLFAPGLFGLLPLMKAWKPNQQAALVSWAFNVGLGAVEESTLRKRLAAGEAPAVVVPEELPKWDKADGKTLEGLKRRRAAEVRLFTGGVEQQQQPAKLTPNSPFSSRITPHITLGEFALNQEVRRFDAQHQVNTAAELAAFMERARSVFGGKPVIITSGYRPAAINRSVGGASSSEHLYNAPNVGAVDFYIQGVDINKLQAWCDKEWPYSLGYGAPKGFVHLGIRAGRPKVRWDY
jgi:GH24 family phage-related lysozyme (muramidase)